MREDLSKAEQTRRRILLVATEEFALHEYAKASTNRIMEEAEMAKGLLFHYFSNKEELYLSCLEHVLYQAQTQLDPFFQNMPYDLFQRLACFLRWKSEFSQDHPLVFRFLYSITKLPPEVRKKADGLLASWKQKNSLLIAEYDQTPWDPEVNQRDAIELVVLVFHALDNLWIERMDASLPQDQEAMLSHALRMLDLLRAGFYRKRS